MPWAEVEHPVSQLDRHRAADEYDNEHRERLAHGPCGHGAIMLSDVG
jgi:hypothetical protein